MKRRSSIAWLACAAAAATVALAPAVAQAQAQPAEASWAQAPYAQHELDQMLAPIALYPDALLAQVLMAATYPLEVAEAERFLRRNPGLSGDALADAVERMPWDPSVQALTQFPSVLAMMNERRDWTEQLGDAFLAQRDQVMDTVQALRERAWAAGNLESNEHQQVIVQDRVIAIEPWRADLLWVPYYNPLIVFGSWWWPAYRPFLWVPPIAYRPSRFAEVYTVGFAWGPYVPLRPRLWHDPRPVWRDRYVVIDNARVHNVIVTRPGTPRPVIWRHDPAHRRGLEYRTPPRDRFVPPPDRRWNDRRTYDAAPAWQDRNRPSPPRMSPPPRVSPPARVSPRPDDRTADGRYGPASPRDGFGRPGSPSEPRAPESTPMRVQKPMQVPGRSDGQRPQAAPPRSQPAAPQAPRTTAPHAPRLTAPQPSQIAPPPSRMAPPPSRIAPPPSRIAPPPQSRQAPSAPQRYAPPAPPRAQAHQPPQAHPQAQAQQSRGRGAGPERQRDRRDR
jgi:hypothetical protein